MWDPVASADEIRRTADLGARAVAMSENPSNLDLPSWHTTYWDPVFDAVQECGLPICMHIGSSGKMIDHSPDSPYAVHVALTGTNSMVTAVDLVMSPVFEKFPGVRVVLSEGEAGWAPHILERMDYTWERHRHHSQLRADKRPSEIFREHLSLCFIADQHAIENLEIIGVDNLMWESDYPHSDSLWPHSRSNLEKFLADVPDDIAVKIAEGNARRVFNIPA
jgi:predicted TIM-barrel fold metal-dependent hydrolase